MEKTACQFWVSKQVMVHSHCFIATYSAQCKITTVEDDGLEKLVTALPPAFTSRFGEIVWAQGGTGFGWWPAFIYDPRLTVGSARQLARKNLGKRHLVYFFECHYAPFSCVTDSKLTTWEDGMIEDYHMGKTAKASGRNRMLLFNQAMQAATLEMGKPIELRMEFNHTDQPQVLPSPKFKKPKRRSLTPERQQRSDFENLNPEEKNVKRLKIRGFPLLSDSVHLNPEKHQICVQKNLKGAIASLAKSQAQVESDLSSDSELFCKLSKCSNDGTSPTSIGFIRLPSRAKATFEDARKAIEDELASDTFVAKQEWRFYVPNLGPMSRKQETTLGPLHSFLRLSTYGWTLGDGTTLMSPLHLLIFEPEPPSSE